MSRRGRWREKRLRKRKRWGRRKCRWWSRKRWRTRVVLGVCGTKEV